MSKYLNRKLLVLLFFLSISRSYAQSPTGIVQGTVVTPEIALIQNIKVIFKRNEEVWETVTNVEGKFSFILPKGIYEVTTGNIGFVALKRAKIQVKPNTAAEVTLIPPFEIRKGGKVIIPEYDFFQLEDNDLVIAFYQKEGEKQKKKYKNAILTYNTTTISAKRIEFNSEDFSFKAEGDVFFEHNGKSQQIKKLTGKFNDENLVYQLTVK